MGVEVGRGTTCWATWEQESRERGQSICPQRNPILSFPTTKKTPQSFCPKHSPLSKCALGPREACTCGGTQVTSSPGTAPFGRAPLTSAHLLRCRLPRPPPLAPLLVRCSPLQLPPQLPQTRERQVGARAARGPAPGGLGMLSRAGRAPGASRAPAAPHSSAAKGSRRALASSARAARGRPGCRAPRRLPESWPRSAIPPPSAGPPTSWCGDCPSPSASTR